MSTLYTQKGANIRKTWYLMTFFLLAVIALGYIVSAYFGNPLILYGAVVAAMITNVGSYWFSDKLVIKMTGAKPITKASHPVFWNTVENLSITAGLPMPKVYVVEDPAPNAFATGRNPEHAALAATTGILGILDQSELEGVVAHELSHIGNRDMLVSTVAVVLAGFVAMIADMASRTMMYGGGGRDDNRGNGIFLIVGIIGIILAPLAAKLMHMAISRRREYLADTSGALLTRYPEGLASALEKISAYSQPMRRANNATAHLFIADPFGNDKRGIGQKIAGLFQTHPPASDRIRILRSMDVK
jgi:heat shock protein HtpX